MDISTITNGITKLIDSVKSTLPEIPAFLVAASEVRGGVSEMTVASNIIRRQSEAGAPVGPNEDGSQNVSEAMERIRVEEIMKGLKLDSRIEIVIPVGGIQITAEGSNSGGPVISQGTNVNIVKGWGIIR